MNEIETRYKAVLSSHHGRDFIRDLLRLCQVETPTFDPNNQYQTAFNEGRRYIGLIVLDQIRSLSPEHYLEIVREQLDERYSDRQPS